MEKGAVFVVPRTRQLPPESTSLLITLRNFEFPWSDRHTVVWLLHHEPPETRVSSSTAIIVRADKQVGALHKAAYYHLRNIAGADPAFG